MNTNAIIPKDKCELFIVQENIIDKILDIFNIDKEPSDDATLINIEDIKNIIKNKSLPIIGTVEFSGNNAAEIVFKKLVDYITDSIASIQNIEGILIQFSINPSYSSKDLSKGVDIIYENINDDTTIITSPVKDESLSKEYVKVTALITSVDDVKLF